MENKEPDTFLVQKILSLLHDDGKHPYYLPKIFKWQEQKCPIIHNTILINKRTQAIDVVRTGRYIQEYKAGFTAVKELLKIVELKHDDQLQNGWVILCNSWKSKDDPSRLSNPKTKTSGSLIKIVDS